jgi:hypothetical protein
MNLEGLPIGTICSVKGIDDKVMVIGYDKKGYVGGLYPDGVKKKADFKYFNKDDIKEVLYTGYTEGSSDETTEVTENTEIAEDGDTSEPRSTEHGVSEEIPATIAPVVPSLDNSRFKFDENGFVVEDNTIVENVEATQNPTYKFDENGFVVEDGSVPAPRKVMSVPITDWEPEPTLEYKFDENGIVIAEPTRVSATPIWESVPDSNFIFDENGIVIGEKSVAKPGTAEPVGEASAAYTFNENGVVIGDSDAVETSPSYQFDENGTVIGDSTVEVTAEPVAESVAESSATYTFNENGVVTGDSAAVEETPNFKDDEESFGETSSSTDIEPVGGITRDEIVETNEEVELDTNLDEEPSNELEFDDTSFTDEEESDEHHEIDMSEFESADAELDEIRSQEIKLEDNHVDDVEEEIEEDDDDDDDDFVADAEKPEKKKKGFLGLFG